MIAEHIVTEAQSARTNLMRSIALAYAKRGIAILPAHGITNGKCDCGHDHPAVNNGAHPCSYFTHMTATCDPAIILGWFDMWPNMNFAVAPGRAQEGAEYVLVIIEVAADQEHDELVMVKFAEMVDGHFRIIGHVLTPDSKRHINVEVDAKHDLNFGKIDGAKIYAKDCHVMGAGSLHHSGIAYLWDGAPLPTIPVITGSASINAKSNMSVSAGTASASPAIDCVEAQQSIESDIAVAAEENALPSDFAAIEQAITMRIKVNRALAAQYMGVGFKLCSIATGTKGPKTMGWQDKPITIDQVNHEGLGLIHALSRTCAIDLDNFESAVAWFEAHGIDLHAMLDADDAVQIKSGRPGRGKLVYRLPAGVSSLELVQVKNPDGTMLVEFRSASAKGCQDVLPPTIHPDTGKPYEWGGAGDFKNLPELPADVLALWQSLLTTKAAMKPSHTPVVAQADESIVEGGRNNALFKLGGNAARLGLSPEGIRAALLIENQKRCQPPLPDHEVETIAKSAATNSHGAKEAAARSIMIDETDEEALELAKKAIANTDALHGTSGDTKQPELLGVLRDIAGWNARTARTVQPAFELCTALAACSSVLARDFVSDGSHTNLYTVAVGPSGSGKENALRTVTKIIDAYDPDRRSGKPASDTAVLTVMGRDPASTFVMDELGEVLQGIFSAKAANHQARIGTVFMDLFTKGGDAYRGTEYGIQDKNKANGRERTDLFSPCPSIFGATTAVTLFKGMSGDVIGSGFFPRILYFRAPDKIPMPNFERKDEPMPASVHMWLTAIKTRVAAHVAEIKKRGDLIGMANHQYLPINVPYSAAANLLIQQAQMDIVNRRNACVDDLESTMLTRVVENAGRVALTLALATDPWAVEIGVEHFKTALAIVMNAMQSFTADIRANLFDSKHDKIETSAYNEMLAYFKKHGRAISERTLVGRCRPYKAASPTERAQAIKALEAQSKITKQAGRNTNSVIYLPRG